MTDLAATPVTQYGVLDALLAGAYGAGVPAATVRGWGSVGIGCCEGLGGEVVLVDGELVECTLDGPPRPMADDEHLPFAVVSDLPDAPGVAVRDLDAAALSARIVAGLRSRNLFHAVRLDGTMSAVRVRVPPRAAGFPVPLAEVAEAQVETVATDVPGTLVGYWTPEIYQGIGVAGLHLHFLAADRTLGGHVLEVAVAAATLRMAAHPGLDLRLPTDPVFLATPLSHDEDHRIVAVERGAQE